MKKIILLISLCMFTTTVWAQQDPLNNFINKYKSDSTFTIVNISPQMFRLFAKMNSDSTDHVMDVAKKLKGLRIISKDNARNSKKLFDEANAALSGKNYENLMTIRNHNDHVKFLANQGADSLIHNLIMLVSDNNNFTAISLTGDIKLDELSKIAGSMNIQGFNNLKDLKKLGKKHP